VLGIDSEIVVLHVRDASGDVVGLIDSEAIQAGCYGRTQDCQRNQKKRNPYKSTAPCGEQTRRRSLRRRNAWYVGYLFNHLASRNSAWGYLNERLYHWPNGSW
jgi:hypothetical protein